FAEEHAGPAPWPGGRPGCDRPGRRGSRLVSGSPQADDGARPACARNEGHSAECPTDGPRIRFASTSCAEGGATNLPTGNLERAAPDARRPAAPRVRGRRDPPIAPRARARPGDPRASSVGMVDRSIHPAESQPVYTPPSAPTTTLIAARGVGAGPATTA